jgi:thioredoxin reductase (NADPH)
METVAAHDIIVVGGGPAGLSAGMYAARSGLKVLVVEMLAPGGQVARSAAVENYPGIAAVSGVELGELMLNHALEAGCTVLYDEVSALRRMDDGTFAVELGSGEAHRAPAVICATGAQARQAGFEGEQRFTGHGVSYCAACDAPFFRNKQVFVVGGGTAACEEALHLARVAQKVTITVRGTSLKAFPAVREALESCDNVEVRYATRVVRVDGGPRGLSTIVLEHADSGKLETRSGAEGSFGVFVFAGHDPNVDLVRDLVDLNDGAVVTDAAMRTRTPGLYVAGDMRDTPLRQVLTAAADGAIAATSALEYVEQRGRLRE